MQALRGALATSNQSYWAERTDEQMLAVSAWVAGEGATDQAVSSCARPPTEDAA